MLFSSPAPFWKYADLGSTPARPLEGWESPDKKAAAYEEEEEEEEGDDDLPDVDDADLEDHPRVDLSDKDDEETNVSRPVTAEGDAPAAAVQHSSPPLPTAAPLSLKGLDEASADEASPIEDVSPSRTISRPVSRHLPAAAATALSNAAPLPKLNFGTAPVLAATTGNPVQPVRQSGMVQPPPPAPQRRGFGGLGDEEEGIDLAK